MRSFGLILLPVVICVVFAGAVAFAESESTEPAGPPTPANPCLRIPEILHPGQSSATEYQPETCIVSYQELRRLIPEFGGAEQSGRRLHMTAAGNGIPGLAR